MKYEKPEIQVYDFATDIVQTSGIFPTSSGMATPEP